MSEFNIYFENNPVRGKLWISSIPAQYYAGPIDEKIGIRVTGPSLMRYSKLFDYDLVKLDSMDHRTFDELRYVTLT